MTVGNNTTRPIRVAEVAGPVSVAANEFALDRYPLNAPIDYSPPQLAAIFAAAGGFPVKTRKAIDRRMGRFTERIPDLTWDLFLGRLYQNRPSAFRWRSKAESIERLCDRLVKSLEIQGNDPQTIPIEFYKLLKFFAEPQGKDTGDTKTRTREKFQTALASVPLLREWARMGIDHTSRSVEKRKISGKSRRAPDLALQEFYDGLGHVLLDVFGRRPAVSFNAIDGSAGGPFVRFVKAIFAALQENLTPDMKKADPALLKYLSPSDHAIRNRIQSMLKSAPQKCCVCSVMSHIQTRTRRRVERVE